MTDTIFQTVHGSHLYGFAHAGSDHDTYMVTTSKRSRPRQSVSGDVDVVRIGWKRFLTYAMNGSHQSVEALFSPCKQWTSHVELRPYVESIRVGGSEVFAKYERTIRAFCFRDFKRRRHAVRLASNLADLRRHGRFNPTCDETLQHRSAEMATTHEGESLWRALT